MDYSLEMFYRETWLDRRLQYDPKIFKNKSVLALHESYSNFLWHPDTFMPVNKNILAFDLFIHLN
jgi:hypothetical protein